MTPDKEFYKNSHVRKRIAEYCGGEVQDPMGFSAQYLVGYGTVLQQEDITARNFISTTKDKFDWILEKGLDIFRSVSDVNYTIGILDIEYFNMDFPGKAYLQPEEVFTKIEPVYKAILKVFHRLEIHPLVIMTGQGYHFAFEIKRDSRTNKALEKIGKLSDNLAATRDLSLENLHNLRFNLAHDGMGRLLEYVSHQVIKEIKLVSPLPVVCTDTAVGKGGEGREAINLDLSMYGDPMNIRDTRCAFSLYQKHKVQKQKFTEQVADATPIQVTIPRIDLSLEDMLLLRQNYKQAADYAAHIHTVIPDASAAVMKLINSYKHSQLIKFHKYFDQEYMHSPAEWPRTYDYFHIDDLPACAAHALRYPNNNLLKPTNIQLITRLLTKLNWHPKHIAGLIRSRYERDYKWGDFWKRYDPCTRSQFYVRLFAGLLADNTDNEQDMNCISHQEKGYCVKPWCGYNLKNYKTQ
jgi:hypothetical protein